MKKFIVICLVAPVVLVTNMLVMLMLMSPSLPEVEEKSAQANPTTAVKSEPCTTTSYGSYGKVTVYHLGQSDEFIVPGGPSAPVCNP